MKPGDFEIHALKKIESFKYSYDHTLKVKRGKKVRCCKSGLQKQGLKKIQSLSLTLSPLSLQKRSTKTRIENSLLQLLFFLFPQMLQKRSTKTRIENFDCLHAILSIILSCKSGLQKQGLKTLYQSCFQLSFSLLLQKRSTKTRIENNKSF